MIKEVPGCSVGFHVDTRRLLAMLGVPDLGCFFKGCLGSFQTTDFLVEPTRASQSGDPYAQALGDPQIAGAGCIGTGRVTGE